MIVDLASMGLSDPPQHLDIFASINDTAYILPTQQKWKLHLIPLWNINTLEKASVTLNIFIVVELL